MNESTLYPMQLTRAWRVDGGCEMRALHASAGGVREGACCFFLDLSDPPSGQSIVRYLSIARSCYVINKRLVHSALSFSDRIEKESRSVPKLCVGIYQSLSFAS